jgi:phosphatidylethanolamine-binding protein (PEBP) family uncharacterized protein
MPNRRTPDHQGRRPASPAAKTLTRPPHLPLPRPLARSLARPLLALLLLLALAALAAGCGETTGGTQGAAQNSTPASASQGQAASTQATTGTTSRTADGSPSQAKHPASQPAVPRRTRSRAHLVLPGPGSHPAPKLTAAQRAHVSIADIALSSPAVKRAGAGTSTLARQYTCQGANTSLPLRWRGIPAGTKELALFVISVRPVNGKLFFDWSIAGLSPSLTGLTAGQLPPGAIPGQNGTGHTTYSICPATNQLENYVIALYALPQKLSPKPGFDPATLREQAITLAHHTGLLLAAYR